MTTELNTKKIELDFEGCPKVVFSGHILKSLFKRVIPEWPKDENYYRNFYDSVILNIKKHETSLIATNGSSLRRQILTRDLRVENILGPVGIEIAISSRRLISIIDSFAGDTKESISLYFRPGRLIVADSQGNLGILVGTKPIWEDKAKELLSLLDKTQADSGGSISVPKSELVNSLKSFDPHEPCFLESDKQNLVITQKGQNQAKIEAEMKEGIGSRLRVMPGDILGVLKNVSAGQEVYDVQIYALHSNDKSVPKEFANFLLISINQEFNDFYFVAIIQPAPHTAKELGKFE